MRSIVLIGMPGCGKSTIGRLLADSLNRTFYDSDKIIESEQNKTITQIFADSGEEFFRAAEADVIKRLAVIKNAVTATGGGAVLNVESVGYLKKDCVIVFIDRPIDEIIADIETDKRPLLKDGKDRLYSLYEKRLPIYRNCADIVIENTGFITDVVKRIIAEVRNFEKNIGD